MGDLTNFKKSLRKEYVLHEGYIPTIEEKHWLIKEYGINALREIGAKKLLN